MDTERSIDNEGPGLPMQSPNSAEVTAADATAGSRSEAPAGSTYGQITLPEATQQMLQELLDLPGQILPAETVHHLKNAGRETLLAFYSLWQNINRASQGATEEKVRKRIEVE